MGVAVRRRLTPYGEVHVADLVYVLALLKHGSAIGSSSSTREKTLAITDMGIVYVLTLVTSTEGQYLK